MEVVVSHKKFWVQPLITHNFKPITRCIVSQVQSYHQYQDVWFIQNQVQPWWWLETISRNWSGHIQNVAAQIKSSLFTYILLAWMKLSKKWFFSKSNSYLSPCKINKYSWNRKAHCTHKERMQIQNLEMTLLRGAATNSKHRPSNRHEGYKKKRKKEMVTKKKIKSYLNVADNRSVIWSIWLFQSRYGFNNHFIVPATIM